MKKVIFISIFFGFVFLANSQRKNASVEKSIFGVQTNSTEMWGYTELKVTDEIAMRIEVGLESFFFGGKFYDQVDFAFIPVVTLEPRWYYNLEKRMKDSKHTDGNSGNFLSIYTSYHSDLWITFNEDDNFKSVSDVSIIPTWGIRRPLGKHFIYELGLGAGYRYYFSKQAGFEKDRGEISFNVNLRVGYDF